MAQSVQKHVEDCEEAFDKVFYALLDCDGRITFCLPRPRDGVRQKLDHAFAILADLTRRQAPFYVGITQMPCRRWHGLYLDG